MKRFLLILFVFLCTASARLPREDFPLWGETWIIGQGENAWIFPSAARFRPQKVALVTFNKYRTDWTDASIAAEIRYANLQTANPMYSTAEALNEMMRQFNARIHSNRSYLEFVQRFMEAEISLSGEVIRPQGDLREKYNEIAESLVNSAEAGLIKIPFGELNKEFSPLHIEYFPYNDTLWTLHRYANQLATKNRYILRFGAHEIDTDDISGINNYARDNPDEIWTAAKPLLTTYRTVFPAAADSYISANFDISAPAMTSDCITAGEGDNLNILSCTEVFAPKGLDALNAGDDQYRSTLIRNRDGRGQWELIEYHNIDSLMSNKVLKKFEDFTTEDIGFWRLHIAPEVWFFRRDNDGEHLTRIMDSVELRWNRQSPEAMADVLEGLSDETDGLLFAKLAKQHRAAWQKRQEMAAEKISDAVSLQEANAWLSPVLSEAFSTIISVSFRGAPQSISTSTIDSIAGCSSHYGPLITRIFLDSQDPDSPYGSKDLFYSHIPPRMYMVTGNSDLSIKRAAVKLHSQNNCEEREAAKLFDVPCDNWEFIDSLTSTYVFPAEDSDGVAFPREAVVINNEGKEVKKLIPRRRNPDIDDAIFMYDGCPVDIIPGVGLTPAELRRYIYMPVPTVSLEAAQDALSVFERLKTILEASQDQIILQAKIAAADAIVKALAETYRRLQEEYRRAGMQWPPVQSRPRIWIDEEPIQRLLGRY